MSDLPQRLAESQPVTFLPRRDDGFSELKAAVDRKFVHVRFTETRGGTEIGVPLEAGSDLSGADWEGRKGTIHIEGELELDGVRARCIADLDIASLQGTGRLQALSGAEVG